MNGESTLGPPSGARAAASSTSTGRERRLPVYLLVDGDIGPGSEDLASLPGRLGALGRVFVRSIVYGPEARDLSGSWTRCRDLGEALRCVSQSLEQETQRRTPGDPGDYPPLIFILASNAPEGDWVSPALAVRTLTDLRLINVLGFGFSEAAVRALSQLTHTVFAVSSEPSALADCLDWIERATETTLRLAAAAASRHKLVRAPALPKTLRHVAPQL